MFFSSERLQVFALLEIDMESLLETLPHLLTKPVVKHLPASFHHIVDSDSAKLWLAEQLSQGQVYAVKHKQQQSLIGLLFLSEPESGQVHLGYLLGQAYWGQGLASELLQALFKKLRKSTKVNSVLAGVSAENKASIALLDKLGFTRFIETNVKANFFKIDL